MVLPEHPDAHAHLGHPAAWPEEQLLKTCQTTRSRASGPGGQHRNKVETAITLTHQPSGVQGSASERRSQAQNARMALFRLRINLAMAVRSEVDLRLAPSRLLASRIVQGRLQINAEHADFPAILAEVLDLLAVKRWEPSPVADLLGTTPTQLIKLLKKEPASLVLCNAQRQARGMHVLK